jgi:hypothetical protein
MCQAGYVLAGTPPVPEPHLESIQGQLGAQEGDTCQPTTARLKTSMMNAAYLHPGCVRM